jgi:hypothetical protein
MDLVEYLQLGKRIGARRRRAATKAREGLAVHLAKR